MAQNSRRRNLHRCFRLAAVLSIVFFAVRLGVGDQDVAAATGAENSIGLSSQSPFVAPGQSFRLSLQIRAALPPSRLGVKIALYSHFTTVSGFESALDKSSSAKSVALSTTNTIGIAGSGATTSKTVALTIGITTAASEGTTGSSIPTLDLSCSPLYCDGVYPLQVALFDRVDGLPIASFTTYLTYLSRSSDSSPLRVGIALPFGTQPSISPAGAPSITKPELRAILASINVLLVDRGARVSVALYPQLVAAISAEAATVGDAATVLSRIRVLGGISSANGRLALLRTGFVPLAPDAFDPATASDEIAAQFTAARETLKDAGLSPTTSPIYDSPSELSARSIKALQQQGIDSFIVPASSLAPSNYDQTETAPFVLESGSFGVAPIAMASNASLSSFFAPSNTPVLAANRLIAELALIGLAAPSEPNRAVVIAPSTWKADPVFLRAFVTGLVKVPDLQSASISSLFSSIPVGANSNPTSASFANTTAPFSISQSAINNAMRAAASVASVVPDDPALREAVTNSVLIAASPTISVSARASYLSSGRTTLKAIGQSLTLLSTRSITLTSRHGTIPMTIRASGPRPVDVVLRLSSSDLEFKTTRVKLALSERDNLVPLTVTSRTSGAFSLQVSLTSPHDGIVLTQANFSVNSTAISGVAIVLSLAALAVLCVWWARSHLRRRRTRQGAISAPVP